MAILHLHGSLTGSSDHQYSATVRSSRENPGISFLKRGRNPTRLIYSTASSTSWMHFGSFHFTPCMIHSPASFPMALSFLCFAVLSIPHIYIFLSNNIKVFHRSSRRTPCGRTPLAESGLAAFPHPALCETNRSHLSIVYTDI